MTLDEKALDCAREAWIAEDPDTQHFGATSDECLRAAIVAYLQALGPGSTGEAEESEFEVWLDDMPVASAHGPRERALREAFHYAVVYGQDGPVEVKEVVRTSVPLPSAMLAAAVGTE